MKTIWKALNEMTDDEQERHKSLHAVRPSIWKESGTLWEHAFGNRDWPTLHEEDHTKRPQDFAHKHKEKAGE